MYCTYTYEGIYLYTKLKYKRHLLLLLLNRLPPDITGGQGLKRHLSFIQKKIFYNYKKINRGEVLPDTQKGGSAASSAGGPLTAARAFLEGGVNAASLAATRAAPGEHREVQLAASRRFEAGRGPEAGQRRDRHAGIHPGLV